MPYYKGKEKTAAFTAAERRLLWSGARFESDERILCDFSRYALKSSQKLTFSAANNQKKQKTEYSTFSNSDLTELTIYAKEKTPLDFHPRGARGDGSRARDALL